MCLITKQEEPIILKEDLIVYKVLRRRNGSLAPYSMGREFEYEVGQTHKTDIKVSIGKSIVADFEAWGAIEAVEEKELENCTESDLLDKLPSLGYKSFGPGFHFMTSKKRANEYPGVLVRCTIPAGSEVHYDMSGLGVANQIRIDQILDEGWGS